LRRRSIFAIQALAPDIECADCAIWFAPLDCLSERVKISVPETENTAILEE
jgi:hypothetical protein